MSLKELSTDTFQTESQMPGIVVVEGWAGWCKPCRKFAPVYEAAARRHPAHHFATLDTEAHQDLAAILGIEQIPTLMIYRDGILLLQQAGTMSDEGIDDLIAQAEELDMDQVRAALDRAPEVAS